MSARPTPARSVPALAGVAAARAAIATAASTVRRRTPAILFREHAPMSCIVDGMNVIGSRPDGWWRDRRGAQRALVQALGELGEPMTVIFDGAPHDTEPPPGVEVAFAPHADDEIAARAAPGVTVITSDRGLAER